MYIDTYVHTNLHLRKKKNPPCGWVLRSSRPSRVAAGLRGLTRIARVEAPVSAVRAVRSSLALSAFDWKTR